MRILVCVAGALMFCGPYVRAADTAPGPADHDKPPVNHDALLGTWTRARVAPADNREVDRFLGFRTEFTPGQTAIIVIPTLPPLKPKLLQQWKKQEQAVHAADLRGEPLANGHSRCLPDGMPSIMMAMFPMEVLAAPGDITIVEEAYRQVRHIYLDQKQIPIADAEPGFWGHSVGHWDGNTLVVNTVGIKDYVRLEDVPHSDQMQIDERIRLLSPDTFQDAITVRDPVDLTGPWSFTWTYRRAHNYKMLEYVCEDNREDSADSRQRLKLFDSSAKP